MSGKRRHRLTKTWLSNWAALRLYDKAEARWRWGDPKAPFWMVRARSWGYQLVLRTADQSLK